MPFDPVTALDMALDLGAKAKHETAFGKRSKVPRGVCRRHRAARKCNRNRRSQLEPARMLCCQSKREKCVVTGLHRPPRLETHSPAPPPPPRHFSQISRPQ